MTTITSSDPGKGLNPLSFAEARRFVEKYSQGVRDVVGPQVAGILASVREHMESAPPSGQDDPAA
jgi:hypothetical protein